MIMRSETGPLREGFLKGMIIALKLKKQLGIIQGNSPETGALHVGAG